MSPSITRSWSGPGSLRTVCSVVTTGISQFTQETQNVTTSRTAEDAKLMLQAYGIDIADIEEVGRPQIGRQILLFNLEANHLGVLIAAGNVVDRHGKAVSVGIHAGNSGQE